MRKYMLSILFLFPFLKAKHNFDDFLSDVNRTMRNMLSPIEEFFYTPRGSENFVDVFGQLKNGEITKAKKLGITVDEGKESFTIKLSIDMKEALSQKNVVTERDRDSLKIRILTDSDSHFVYLAGDKYVIKMKSQEAFKEQKEESKNFASSVQELVRQGTLKQYIDGDKVSIEIDQNNVTINAAYKLHAQCSSIPVKFLNQEKK